MFNLHPDFQVIRQLLFHFEILPLFIFQEETSCEFGSNKYYALCGFGGILSCGITHTAVVPLDLVKCRIQVNPEKYGGIVNGFRLTVQEGGMKELAKGWAPTAIGYSAQGLCKFGFYEVFKIVYGNAMGEVISVFFSYEKNYLHWEWTERYRMQNKNSNFSY